MRYWFDTEFIEQPCTIDLISIGMIAEDGREFYAESSEVDWFLASDWVKENVRPHLFGGEFEMTRAQIAERILAFIGEDKSPEFWGYFADYDWVVFCWLFGTMISLPQGWPMFCRDIIQWCHDIGNPRLPPHTGTAHNALDDARWTKLAWEMLDEHEGRIVRRPKNRAQAEAMMLTANQFLAHD